jgi:hypothetical protein
MVSVRTQDTMEWTVMLSTLNEAPFRVLRHSGLIRFTVTAIGVPVFVDTLPTPHKSLTAADLCRANSLRDFAPPFESRLRNPGNSQPGNTSCPPHTVRYGAREYR